MDEEHWPRKVKADTVEGQQGRGSPRFGWLDGVKRALAIRKQGLQEEHNSLEKGVCGENL